jgi:hypothetical protein
MASGNVGSKRVDAVQHAAMAGQQAAGVLDARAALDQRLHQVADHAHGGQEQHGHDISSQGLIADSRV